MEATGGGIESYVAQIENDPQRTNVTDEHQRLVAVLAQMAGVRLGSAPLPIDKIIIYRDESVSPIGEDTDDDFDPYVIFFTIDTVDAIDGEIGREFVVDAQPVEYVESYGEDGDQEEVNDFFDTFHTQLDRAEADLVRHVVGLTGEEV